MVPCSAAGGSWAEPLPAMYAFVSRRSTTPLRLSARPIGNTSGTTFLPYRSRNASSAER